MIHDIEPRIFSNRFHNRKAERQDLFLSFQGDEILVREDKDKLWYPSFADFEDAYPKIRQDAQFLFVIDDISYFLVREQGLDRVTGWSYVSASRFRTETKYWRSFAGAVGWQLNRWYDNHRFCSRCGNPTTHSETERMLFCDACGFQVYPTLKYTF